MKGARLDGEKYVREKNRMVEVCHSWVEQLEEREEYFVEREKY